MKTAMFLDYKPTDALSASGFYGRFAVYLPLPSQGENSVFVRLLSSTMGKVIVIVTLQV